jgi:hypothetical protein
MRNIQTKYFRRAKVIAFLLSLVPFVRMVALDGSLAAGKATEKSDIDFFVVAKSGRIWSARILVTALVQLTGYRRYGQKIAGRICLNRYHSENFLLIRPKNRKNALDYRNFLIFWGSDKARKRYFQANDWIKKMGFSFKNQNQTSSLGERILLDIAWLIQRLFEFSYDILLGDAGESALRNYQVRRILKNPHTESSSSEQIFVSDYELRFHPKKGSRA